MPVYSTSCTDGRLDQGRASATQVARTPRALPQFTAPEPLRGRDGAVCVLRPTGTSSRTARDFTSDTLRSWGMTELTDDAIMIVSELVTNAIRHGVSAVAELTDEHPVKLSLVRNGRFLVCIVTDPSDRDPRPRTAEDTCENGRGLHVVEALSRVWGWAPMPGVGKAVWAALDIP
jgi:anti-sigma regulatory factor (Ser/Thr protein kinase)